MRFREGAPAGNSNAVGHGLNSKTPARRVNVRADVTVAELAEFAGTLGDAAAWVAERLAFEIEDDVNHDDSKLISLYAAVAAELLQFQAELEGGATKAAALGTLSDAAFDSLMQKQANALALILSQCVSAWSYLKARVETNSDLMVERINRKTEKHESRAVPVLVHLAAHIRAAKRLLKDMAANRAWKEGDRDNDDDMAKRIMAIIKEMETK